MSEPTSQESAPDQATDGGDLSADEYGSLSVEDDPEGTVDPGDLAGTADESDHDLPDRDTGGA